MGLAIFLMAGLLVHPWTAQPSSRYLLTVAIVDDHDVVLDPYEGLLRTDYAFDDGHFFSDKAPYQPLFAVPVYQAFRLAGGDAFPRMGGDAFPGMGGDANPDAAFHHGRWLVTLWTATLPAIGLSILMRRLVRRTHPTVATPVALALSLGTVLLPFSGLLFGHMLSAALLTGGWVLVQGARLSSLRAVGAGLLFGAAVGTEFPVVLPVLLLVAVVLVRFGLRSALLICAGGAAAAVPLAIYNWVAFGGPLSVAYQGRLPNFEGSGALGVYNLQPPIGREVAKALVGDRGMFTLTPVLLCALVGATIVLARRLETSRDAIVALLVLAVLLAISTGIDGYGGATPGPRYLIPAIPFFAVPLAAAWTRRPLVCAAAAILGTLAMTVALITGPLIGTNSTKSLSIWITLAREGFFVRSIPGELAGAWGLVACVILGLAAAVAAVAVDACSQNGGRPGVSGHALQAPQA